MADDILRTGENLTLANGGGGGATSVDVGADGAVHLPAGFNFGTAEFTKAGPDLIMTAPDGRQVIVEDYFASENPAKLQTPQGGELEGATAARLAAANTPAQFAQAAPGAAEQPIGQVQTITGTVTAIRANGTKVELSEGDAVYQGDILQSSPNGSVGIVLADETTFSMAENGRMVLDEMVYDPSTQEGNISMSVLQGVFTFVSGQVAKVDPDAMSLKTPVATIGIRGTQVGVNLGEEGGAPKLDVVLMEERDGFVGEVVISNNAGIQILNLPDQGTRISRIDVAPQEPRVMPRVEVRENYGHSLDHLPQNVGTGNNYQQKGTVPGQRTDAGSDVAGFQTAAGPGAGGAAAAAATDEFAVVNRTNQAQGDGTTTGAGVVDFEVAAGGAQNFGDTTAPIPASSNEVPPAAPAPAPAPVAPAPAAEAPPAAAPAAEAPRAPEPVRDTDGADGVNFTVTNATGTEDANRVFAADGTTPVGNAVDLNLGFALKDADGSETVTSVTISGVPAGVTLSAGIDKGDGTWTLTQAQLSGLKYIAPNDFSGTVNLSITVNTTDATTGGANSTGSQTQAFTVTIAATEDLSVSASASVPIQATGLTQTIALNLATTITDTDGSETVSGQSLDLSNLPANATLTFTKNGVSETIHLGAPTAHVDLAGVTLSTVSLTVPTGSGVNVHGVFNATSNEGGDETAPFDINIQQPQVSISVTSPTGVSETDDTVTVALGIDVTIANTTSTGASITFTAGFPAGATFNAGTFTNGVWSGTVAELEALTVTLPKDYSGEVKGDISVSTSCGVTATGTSDFDVAAEGDLSVSASAMVPAQATGVTETINLSLGAAATDVDGSEHVNALTLDLSGLPAGASLQVSINGVLQTITLGAGSQSVNLLGADLSSVKLIVPTGLGVDVSGSLHAKTDEGGDKTASFDIDIPAPSISVTVGNMIDVATGRAPNETDGPVQIALNIDVTATNTTATTASVTFTGLPAGATFNAGTVVNGVWSGTVAELEALTVTMPADAAANLTAAVTVHTVTGNDAVTSATLNMGVEGDLSISAGATVPAQATGLFETIPLNISAVATDADGSEHVNALSLSLTGLPVGASIQGIIDGVMQTLSLGAGSQTLNLLGADLSTLKLIVPTGLGVDVSGTVHATTDEGGDKTVSFDIDLPTPSVTVTVGNMIDVATGQAPNETDGPVTIALNIDVNAANTVATTASVTFTGLPAGATFNAGTLTNGVWSGTVAELEALTVTMPADAAANLTAAVKVNTLTGNEANTSATLNMGVEGDLAISASVSVPA